jgi:tetratricopeptide (TPR) repeat protein
MRISRRIVGLILTSLMFGQTLILPAPLAFLIAPACAQTAPNMPPLTTIRQAIKDGIKLNVQGDGATTTKLSLQLTNTGTRAIKVVIPANEVLKPNSPGVQTMIITQDLVVPVNPGETAIVSVPTICGSPKTVPPPPEVTKGLDFNPGNYQDPVLWAKLAAVVAAGKELEMVGGFGDVMMVSDAALQGKFDDEIKKETQKRVDYYLSQNPGKTKEDALAALAPEKEGIEIKAKQAVHDRAKKERSERITQLAIWRMIGLETGKPEDAVTTGSLSADTVKEIAYQIKMDPALLQTYGGTVGKNGSYTPSAQGKEALDKKMQSIFDVVDLTVHRSAAAGLSNIAGLPKDDPCDTFTQVGERAFGQGDFTIAQEMLNSAVKLVEGEERDPRLSRALNSLGLCYLNMTSFNDAQSCFDRAKKIRVAINGGEAKEVAEIDNNLGVLDQILAKYDPADTMFNDAVSIYEKTLGKTSDSVAGSLNNLGKNKCLVNKPDEGSAQLSRALALAIINCPEDVKGARLYTPFVAEVETNLADAYRSSGKNAEAAALYQKALAVDVKCLGNDHPYIANILDGLAQATARQATGGDADGYKKQADGIRERSLASGAKDLANLPLGTADLGRLRNYIQGKKDFQFSIASVRAGGSAATQQDLTRMNRPIKDKWALVIGISQFKDSAINLQYAAKDASDFANYLVKEGNFAPDHVRLLTNRKATRAEILNQLGGNWLPRVASPDDLVMVYFSSHGSPGTMDVGNVNYLVAYDTDKTNLYGTGISLQDFTTQLKERVHSDRVVLLMDACHSGAAIASGAKGLLREQNVDAAQIAQGSGQFVICSSLADESSWESTRYKNGVFTHYLLEGLRKNNNQNKMGDVFSFMKEQVQHEVQMDRNGAMQTPALQTKWLGNDLIVGVKPSSPHEGIPDPTFAVDAPSATTADANAKAIKPATTASSKAPIAKSPAVKAQVKPKAPVH